MGKNSSSKRLWVLIVLLLGLLGGLGYFAWGEKENIDDLEEEKAILIVQLEEYKRDLHAQTTANDSLNGFIAQETLRLNEIIERVEGINAASASEMRGLRNEVFSLRSKVARWTEQIDSVNTAYQALMAENSELEANLTSEVDKNMVLSLDNAKLSEDVANASKVQLSSIEASAYRVNNKGVEQATQSVKNADRVKVCMTIAKNVLASKGKQMLYLQITSPTNGLVETTGTIQIQGKPCDYTVSQEVDYNGEPTGCCLTYQVNEGLVPGAYTLMVYTKDEKIGESRLELK